ncbi:MAG TPA: carboxypeptidase-like regulatory domain-containing protein [Thermoguttaceae bacterium]|nr:carboxypeptidase-like regulatory domain-containing protein [Thermoguttaceae bacterium]HPP53466.1 carboxypeptidase-like regulatory domain-containing protein [Thermoguttaceae bacterium]
MTCRHKDFIRIVFVLLGVVVCLAGCGRKENLTPVSGTVLLDGKPLDGATVTFHPVKGGAVGHAKTDASGRFTVMTGTLHGLKPGEYIVTVQKTGEAAQGDSLAPEKPPAMLTPLQYANVKQSPLKYTAPGGPANFELSSK